MPSLRRYAVFICHDWEYGDDYYRICQFLDDAPNFRWRNLSVPRHDPFDNDEMLEKNLRDQIRPAYVVLVLAGMYAVRSGRWTLRCSSRGGSARLSSSPSIGGSTRRTQPSILHMSFSWSGQSLPRRR